MKIGGVDPTTLKSEEILVLPRGEENIVLRAHGVPNYDEFNTLCPEPTPPRVQRPKVGWVENEEDPGYKDMVATRDKRRIAWLVINSLTPSDIEWDTVDYDNPSTWVNWEDDLQKGGLSQVECNRIMKIVFQANSLDEDKLKEARETFLAGHQPDQNVSSGLSIAPETTQSGEPASE